MSTHEIVKELRIYSSKNSCRPHVLKRILKVYPLKVIGNISDVPIDKTYQNRFDNVCFLKLEIEENGYIEQRGHNLYKNSKKGYYCIVCQHKVYFTDEEIDLLNKIGR